VKSCEYYLNFIGDWIDPNPKPVIQKVDDYYVVRDDLLGYGSKARFIDFLIKNEGSEWVFGGSNKVGWGPISLSYVCKKYNKKATFFMAKRKSITEQQQKVLDLGGNIIWVNMGMLNVTLSRAKKYYEENITDRRILPLGLEHPSVFGSIIKVARNIVLPEEISEIWTVGSSGTLSRGLQLAFPNTPVNVVQTGHKLSERELGRAKLYVSPYKFDSPVKESEMPPYNSEKFYDAKIWSFIKKYSKKNSLIWNVA
jgi:hypothetical protein